jgi:hypothetical protein
MRLRPCLRGGQWTGAASKLGPLQVTIRVALVSREPWEHLELVTTGLALPFQKPSKVYRRPLDRIRAAPNCTNR